MTQIKSSIVLCLDEVDEAFQHPKIASDFFGLLRAWHEDAKVKALWKNLRLVIVHSKEVYIPLNINQSPFNVGVAIELPPLTEEQVIDLVQRHGLNWTEKQFHPFIAMLGGHPFLSRVALYQIARGDMTLGQVLDIAPTEEGLYGEHLRRHLRNLEEDEKLVAALKQVIVANEPIQIDSTAAFKLASMGLVRFHRNAVLPLCDLYRRYFQERLGVSS